MKTPAADTRVELLFEVGCEEIPAGMLPKAEQDLRTNIEKLLDRKSTRLNSSHLVISYAVFCLKKKKINTLRSRIHTSHTCSHPSRTADDFPISRLDPL